MSDKTFKQITSEIAVLEDFRRDCRQHSRSLETLSMEIDPSLILSAHIHAAIGSLMLLGASIQRDITLAERELRERYKADNRRH